MFACDENLLELTGQDYPGRSYSFTPNNPLDCSNYVPSSYHSHNAHIPDGFSLKHSRSWSNDSVAYSSPGLEPSLYDPREVNSYHTSLSSPIVSHSSWSNLPSTDTHETVTIIDHPHYRLPVSSCFPLSTISSPSPSLSPIRQTITGAERAKYGGRLSAYDGSVKVCAHCHATSTPLWRREPSTLRPLCNACGLYLQQHGKLRPKELIEADKSDDGPEIFDCDGTGPQCSHCHTRNTSVWRRSKTGEQLCNACGVYARLRGRDRPLSLTRRRIRPRTKHPRPADIY